MSIEKLYPFAGEHAVQNVVFIVEWADQLTTDALVEACKLATKYRNLGLPEMSQQNMLEVKFHNGEAQGQSAQTSSGLGGVQFTSHARNDGSARMVVISRTNIMVMIPDYTRWDIVWTEVQAYLKPALEQIGSLRPINVIGLQYNDVFSWQDDPSELDLSEVFVKDCFIPLHALEQKGLWHLHHGYIEKRISPVGCSLLHNLNVDLNDVNGQRRINIVGSHRASLVEPLWQSHLKNKSVVLDMFVALHTSNKVVLEKLLTPAVCEKIKLNAS